MNTVAGEKETLNRLEGTAKMMCQNTAKISIVCESEANVPMAPWIRDLRVLRTVNRTCTVENKGHFKRQL